MTAHKYSNGLEIRRLLPRAAAIGALFGTLVISLPSGLAMNASSPHGAQVAVEIAAKIGLFGGLYGMIAGAIIGMAISLAQGRKAYLVGLVSGVIWGVLAELVTWHHVEGLIVMLAGVEGLLIALILSKYKHVKKWVCTLKISVDTVQQWLGIQKRSALRSPRHQ